LEKQSAPTGKDMAGNSISGVRFGLERDGVEFY